jgi:hypothetical protein
VEFARSEVLKRELRGSVETALTRVYRLRGFLSETFYNGVYGHVDAETINVILEMLSPFTDTELLDLECEFEDYNERYFNRNGIISDEIAQQIRQKMERFDAYTQSEVNSLRGRFIEVAKAYIKILRMMQHHRILQKGSKH